VTVLGLLLGRRVFNLYGWVNYRGGRSFDRIDERLATLGLGLLLHDVGKLIVPSTVLNKPGPLDTEEWELVRRHPVAGIELLPGDAISPLAKSVVRSHHERWDGSGYPDRRAGGKISQLARIASVADVYDAITSERPYRDARPAHVGHGAIVEGAGSEFDPEVVAAFRKVVAPYPVGTEITLRDGRSGIVASLSASAPDRPVVRITHDAEGRLVDPVEIPIAGLGDVDEQAAA
jgi:HD-GYP domain-containing protein (c-di-GMP phosphodiesterase class II)